MRYKVEITGKVAIIRKSCNCEEKNSIGRSRNNKKNEVKIILKISVTRNTVVAIFGWQSCNKIKK